MKKNWFSVIIAMLMTAFLIVISAWILALMLQESKNTRLVSNTINTYAWAQWSLEYALLKAKNHREWFQDKISTEDSESKLLRKDEDSFKKNIDTTLEYEMRTFSQDYTWTLNPVQIDVIPLFFDNWKPNWTNTKNPNPDSSDIIKTNEFSISWNKLFVWNIVWNDNNWVTYWISWTWSVWKKIWCWAWSNIIDWKMKYITEYNWISWASEIKIIDNKDICEFLEDYSDNYLLITNASDDNLEYNIKSDNWFATPKTEIIASSSIWDFKQNILFNEDKSSLYEILKYSIVNK